MEFPPLLIVELVPVSVPVVIGPLALLRTTLLVLFRVVAVEAAENVDVVTIAAAEVDIFVLVVDTLTEVLTDTGNGVVPGEERVEEALV